MSYKIGQLKSDDISFTRAVTQLDFDISSKKTTAEFASNTTFYDKKIILKGSANFEADSYYYVKLAIAKFGLSEQDLIFQLLSGTDEEPTGTQFLGNTVNYHAVDYSNPDSFKNIEDWQKRYFSIIEMIISPDDTYSQLDIILNRNIYDYVQRQGDDAAKDYSEEPLDGNTPIIVETDDLSQKVYQGRVITIDKSNCCVYKINNIMQFAKNGSVKVFSKIGIQGPPGLLFCINGEGIRIGPSGIYELRNSNYNINFLGVVPKISLSTSGVIDYDSFIIDYQYNVAENDDII